SSISLTLFFIWSCFSASMTTIFPAEGFCFVAAFPSWAIEAPPRNRVTMATILRLFRMACFSFWSIRKTSHCRSLRRFTRAHCGPPVAPKRSVLIRSGLFPDAVRRAGDGLDERGRATDVEGRRDVRGPGRAGDQRAVDTAGRPRPIRRRGAGVGVGQAEGRVMIPERLQLIPVPDRCRSTNGVEQSKRSRTARREA